MRRAVLTVGGVVLFGGIAWWAMPSKVGMNGIDLTSLGPPDACACDPIPSPPLREWTACAVTALDQAGRLEGAIFADGQGVWHDAASTRVPEAFSKSIREVAEPECGSYDEALALAKDLQEKRNAVGYGEYFIFETPAAMFVGWSADDLRGYARNSLMRDRSS